MNSTRLDLPHILVESKINDMKREAAHWKLVDELRAEHESGQARARRSLMSALIARLLDGIAWLALVGRRAEMTARQRAMQPKTRSQTMQIP